MWVTKDKSGSVHLWFCKPIRIDERWISNDGDFCLEESSFPHIKWEDEPVEIELESKNNFYYKLIYWTTWLGSKDEWVERFFSDFESAEKEAKRMKDLGAQSVGVYKCFKPKNMIKDVGSKR